MIVCCQDNFKYLYDLQKLFNDRQIVGGTGRCGEYHVLGLICI